MVFEIAPLTKPSTAMFATVRFVARMETKMDFEGARRKEALPALFALMRSDAGMAAHVVNERVSMDEGTIAFCTFVNRFFLVLFVVFLYDSDGS